ncbi:MAG: YHS domain-containing protein [bacterium]|nr:YHS domain-containing protein [bacterium]
MVHDPVCGMEIKDVFKAEKLDYQGKTYYFCSNDCKSKFQQSPEKYVKKDDEHMGHHH